MSELEETGLMERRRFIRNAATIAWAAPVILTLGASAAQAQAVSCVAAGEACGVGSPTPTRPCCDTGGAYCCCQETKTTGPSVTVTRTCMLEANCRTQGSTTRSCVPNL